MRTRIALCLFALTALQATGFAQDKPATGNAGQESKNAPTSAPGTPGGTTAKSFLSPPSALEGAKPTPQTEQRSPASEHHKHPASSKQRYSEPIDPNWRAKWLAEQAKKAQQEKAEKAQATQQTPSAPPANKTPPPVAGSTSPPVPTSGNSTGPASNSVSMSGNPPAAAKPAEPVAAPPTSGSKSAPANGVAPPKPDTKSQSAKSPDPLFDQTKPDGIGATEPPDRPQENPLAAMGDAWKMLLYLVPMLLVIVGALRLLRRFQERNGRLPGLVQAAARRSGKTDRSRPQKGSWIQSLMGGLSSGSATQKEGSIRLIESQSVGGANLHLIQVRGKMLLLGSAGGEVRVLTEFKEQEGVAADDFRLLLQTAAADIDSLEFDDAELPASTLVGSLESAMRDTGDAMSRRIRRLRTVQEAEESVD